MTLKMVTHSVSIPPLTDIPAMLGAYRALLNALGIPNQIEFALQGMFHHPIPEVNVKVTAEFMWAKTSFETAKMMYENFALQTVRVQNTTALFIFTYTDYE